MDAPLSIQFPCFFNKIKIRFRYSFLQNIRNMANLCSLWSLCSLWTLVWSRKKKKKGKQEREGFSFPMPLSKWGLVFMSVSMFNVQCFLFLSFIFVPLGRVTTKERKRIWTQLLDGTNSLSTAVTWAQSPMVPTSKHSSTNMVFFRVPILKWFL